MLSLLKELAPDLAFKRFLDLFTMFYGQLPMEECSALFCAHILGIPQRGFYNLKGAGPLW